MHYIYLQRRLSCGSGDSAAMLLIIGIYTCLGLCEPLSFLVEEEN